MNKLEYGFRRSFKRHSEAFLIVTFVLFDCLASGWILDLSAMLAIVCVMFPAARTLWTLSPIERPTFVKAYLKTAKVQKLAILLFWAYSIRFLVAAATSACLFKLVGPRGELPSLSSALLAGAKELGPLTFLAAPIFIYIFAALIAIVSRMFLRATKQDPDLVAQRQRWSGVNHCLFSGAFVSSILCVTMNPNGPGYMLSSWLLTSAEEANIFNGPRFGPSWFGATAPVPYEPVPFNPVILYQADPSGVFADFSFVQPFDAIVLSSLSLGLFLILRQPAARMHAFLNSFCWRVLKPQSLQNIVEAFLEALRLPTRALSFREARPFVSNAFRTLAWILFCYASLFWLFGFCGGPLGYAIQSWMMTSAIDAGYGAANNAPGWLFEEPFRIFLGSIVALYGTAPFAVTACAFLPFSAPRKIFLNCDGISFGQGPFVSLWGRQFRLWSDLKSLTVKSVGDTEKDALRAKFVLKFRSGGHVNFNGSQFSSRDLQVFLESIDQYASACEVEPEVYKICEQLCRMDSEKAASDGIADTTIASIPASEFKATVFSPYGAGEFLPGTKMRIIKLLSSKPLCAVYLARTEEGRMVTVKQFYLADDTEETRALEKILKREYELLTALDNPGIAKVIECSSFERSTFLVIEHRLGSDLREIVTEHGARSESLTIAWARQLCEIMIHLHSRQPAILHRDLAPDNIIVGEDGNLRLIDFGAAREFLEGITGTMLGKHSYVSPEQLRGDATVRSDIYSFGATLFFLLTGRDPIALSQSSPEKSTDCSLELDKLIRDCTEFDEIDRPQSFEEILKRLDEMDSGFMMKLSSSRKEKVVA